MKVTLILLLIIKINAFPKKEDLFKLHVVHLNDFHSRFDEVNLKGRECTKNDTCVGGYSRLYKQIMSLKEKDPNILLLNAGDNFQGSMWYSVYKWDVIRHFMEKFQFDAYTLGNHEFDDNIEGIVPFIKSINAPVVLSNVDDTEEPTFQNTYTKSTVVAKNGKKIGIIGALTKEANEICHAGKLVFLDESESINKEAERLVKEEDVFTNIVLSHCGYDVDKEVAKKATGKIGLIVGGHSHTYLGDDTTFKPKGPYPTVVQRSSDGGNVLIVQASSFSRHLGNITVYYNNLGDIVEWDGAPIFLSHDLPQDEEINKEMSIWNEKIEVIKNEVLGETLVPLEKAICNYEECLFGNFLADAMVFEYMTQSNQENWTHGSIAFMNPKGFRSDIDVGSK
ncbi:unnamed protein product [Brassicogethes aeneus]|uniref:apyrase n=1 Tax=Brassicogethes aeneus TaxID=1431903 RepID=A0A9P0AQ44_BRAAE|nr:unnamed protein product [Brassicogethes aeneus]